MLNLRTVTKNCPHYRTRSLVAPHQYKCSNQEKQAAASYVSNTLTISLHGSKIWQRINVFIDQYPGHSKSQVSCHNLISPNKLLYLYIKRSDCLHSDTKQSFYMSDTDVLENFQLVLYVSEIDNTSSIHPLLPPLVLQTHLLALICSFSHSLRSLGTITLELSRWFSDHRSLACRGILQPLMAILRDKNSSLIHCDTFNAIQQ